MSVGRARRLPSATMQSTPRGRIIKSRSIGKSTLVGGTIMGHISEDQNPLREDTDTSVHALIEKASRMGLTDDIREMVDDVNTLKEILHKKNFELDMLELIAMNSDDDNISELREQLFATVKLIHSDMLATMLADRESDEAEEDYGVLVSSAKKEPKMDNSTFLDKLRGAWYRRRELRKLTKQARQQIKKHLKNDVDPNFISKHGQFR